MAASRVSTRSSVRTRRSVATVAALALAASALVSTGPVRAAEGEPVELRVMTFNVFYGGDELDLRTGTWCRRPAGCPETFAQVVQAVKESEANVVALQEPAMHTRRLAEALGWHFDERMHVISEYPLVDPPDADGAYTFVEPVTGEVAAIANVHLVAEPYGPYELRDGATVDDVLALEEATRLREIMDYLHRLQPVLDNDEMPVFLAGDFNSPSHLDWTEEATASRGIAGGAVAWPASVALEHAGFVDSYRAAGVHPDPVEVPGFTWAVGGPESVRDEVHDRIDWVLAAGPAQATASEIVGEVGGPDVDIVVDPYPSDHRGVVSTFEVSLADMPPLVAVDTRRIERGDDLAVRYHVDGIQGTIELEGQHRSVGADGDDGTVTFGTTDLDPGEHTVRLLDGDGGDVAAAAFWVVEPGATPRVWTDQEVYRVGEDITVRWEDAYGHRLDWLAVTSPGHNHTNPIARTCTTWPCSNQRYLLYEYLGAEIAGEATFDAGSGVGWTAWPLTPGTYEIRMLLDDHYRSVASSPRFRIVR